MAPPSTEPASAARGPCSPASAPITRWRAGHRDEAEALLTVIENSTSGQSRLLPEQVWDAADIPALELFRGKPTGSACPLVWAHSEYVKLRRSIRDNKIFDQPPQTVKRYLIDKHVRQIFGWRFNNKTRSVPSNKTLRIVLLTPGRVHWSVDGWKTDTRHRCARHWSRHLHARLADCIAAAGSAGRVHVFLAAGESLGRHGLCRYRRERL